MRSLKLNKLAVQINALLLATAGYPLAANAAPVDIAEQPLHELFPWNFLQAALHTQPLMEYLLEVSIIPNI